MWPNAHSATSARREPEIHNSGEREEIERVRRTYKSYARDSRKARAWSAENPGNVAIRAELWRLLRHAAGEQLDHGGEILDAGCGSGFWLRSLLGDGVAPERLHGVDVLPERLAACRETLPARVELRRADVRRLPYPDGSFDVVLMFAVLSSLTGEHDMRQALGEGKRVARPGGVLLIYEPRYPNPLNRRTVRVSTALLDGALGSKDEWPVTVWPPVARRLGRFTDAVYPRLAARRWATSHHLIAHRPC